MRPSTALLLLGFIVGSFGVNAVFQNTPYSETDSFTVLPGQYHYLSFNIVGEGQISGNYVEIQSQLVNFYFLTQQQYDYYRSTGVPKSLLSISNAPSGTYNSQIFAPGTYYLIFAHGTGYYQASEQVTVHVSLDGTNSLYAGLEALTFVGIVAIAIGYIVQRRANRKQILSLLKANPNYGYGQGEKDNRILQIAKDLCRDLRLGFDPVTLYYIVWVRLEGIRVAPSDQCTLGVKGPRLGWLHLPAILRDRLSPNEWKPLIASALIYTFDPKLRRKRRFRYFVVPLALLTVGVLFVASNRLFYTEFAVANSATERFLLLQYPLVIVPMAAIVFLAVRKWNISLRRSFLQSDDIAARVVGKEQMLQTLNKIDSMALPDIEERKRAKPTIWRAAKAVPWPSISERIQILQHLRTC